MITIVIVDCYHLVRVGISRILTDIGNFKVVGEANDGEEAVGIARKLKPKVILIDVKTPGTDGIETTKKLLKIDSGFNIIALGSCHDDVYASRMIKAGAKGYITKKAPPEELITSITLVMKGKFYVSNDVAHRLALDSVFGTDVKQSVFNQLSERELQTAMMITRGLRAAKIADIFCISAKTVNSYRYRIFEKLHVNSDVELAILAIKYKMFNIDELMSSASR
ncbi:MAG: response regulator [Gammaproteobacteria bacterium]|nr:response regulator [Gammaproteobacteria bacterium]